MLDVGDGDINTFKTYRTQYFWIAYNDLTKRFERFRPHEHGLSIKTLDDCVQDRVEIRPKALSHSDFFC
jgi:hypothetical protein